MPQKKQEFFTNRLGILLSMIGIAVGAGNIWRFSRIVAENNGGSFLIPWLFFLFAWSIPLLIAEIALGKRTRKAAIATFGKIAGPKFTWMGAFVTLVTTGILCYYSVVVGWGLRYFVYAISGSFNNSPDYQSLWDNFANSLQPLYFHVISIVLAVFIIFRGIVQGIEKANKILIPILLGIIFILFLRAITLEGASAGLKYLFTPHWRDLFHYKIWLEALTQNAWDTGAGWGLILVYAGYMHKKEAVVKNAMITAVSNNAVSIIMAIILFSTFFAFGGSASWFTSGEGGSGVGLTFILLPKVFERLPGGNFVHMTFSALFFFAFFSAALSSMIAMLQASSQALKEFGLSKKLSLTICSCLVFVVGGFSAVNQTFLENQDMVWSLGLILSGFFIAFSLIRFGLDKIRIETINYVKNDIKMNSYYNKVIQYVIPFFAIVLILWFFEQSIFAVGHSEWWNPLRKDSLGTIVLQWGAFIGLFILCNSWMNKRSKISITRN